MRRKTSNIPPTSSNSEPGVRSFSHVDSSPASSSCSSGSGSPSVALDMAVASFALKTPGWLAQAGIRSELRCRWRARVDWPVSSCRGQGTQRSPATFSANTSDARSEIRSIRRRSWSWIIGLTTGGEWWQPAARAARAEDRASLPAESRAGAGGRTRQALREGGLGKWIPLYLWYDYW